MDFYEELTRDFRARNGRRAHETKVHNGTLEVWIVRGEKHLRSFVVHRFEDGGCEVYIPTDTENDREVTKKIVKSYLDD